MANTLTHSPSDIVRRMFIDLGIGVDPPSTPWPVYAGNEPGSPDNVITLYDTQGIDGGRDMTSGEILGSNGIQVRIRCTDHKTGWTKADSIQRAMAQDVYQETVTISGVSYLVHALSKIGDVLPLGNESPSSKRQLFTINAVVTIRQL